MLFDSIDTDGSNSIDRAELFEFIQLLIQVNAQMQDGKFKDINFQMDGKEEPKSMWAVAASKVVSWSDAINMIVLMQQKKNKEAEE